jgi:hypothetical protein
LTTLLSVAMTVNACRGDQNRDTAAKRPNGVCGEAGRHSWSLSLRRGACSRYSGVDVPELPARPAAEAGGDHGAIDQPVRLGAVAPGLHGLAVACRPRRLLRARGRLAIDGSGGTRQALLSRDGDAVQHPLRGGRWCLGMRGIPGASPCPIEERLTDCPGDSPTSGLVGVGRPSDFRSLRRPAPFLGPA